MDRLAEQHAEMLQTLKIAVSYIQQVAAEDSKETYGYEQQRQAVADLAATRALIARAAGEAVSNSIDLADERHEIGAAVRDEEGD